MFFNNIIPKHTLLICDEFVFQIDDQICLLINSWCELLLFSCCYRSVATPGEIRISLGKSITLAQAKSSGIQTCIERMLNLTDHMRRLRLDRYEYVAMKVIVLLQSGGLLLFVVLRLLRFEFITFQSLLVVKKL